MEDFPKRKVRNASCSSDKYLKKQIITYMGNKRKILKYIDELTNELSKEFPNGIITGDGFSGSGNFGSFTSWQA